MASSKRAVVAAVAADAVIATIKLAAGLVTGSSVMIAEAAHSAVDGANASLMLVGQHRARRPPDGEHPFGHGREVYFWSIVVAMVAFVLGGGFAVIEGIASLHAHRHGPLWVDLGALGAAFLFDGGSLLIGARELARYRREKQYRGGWLDVIRQSHDPPIFATALTDAAALVGVVLAAICVTLAAVLDAPWLDAAGAVLDGVLLMAVAVVLAIETHGLLIGEGARRVLLDDARRTLARHPGIAAVEELRSLQLGPSEVLLVVHARFTDGRGLAELTPLRDDLVARLRAEHPTIRDLCFR